MRLRFTALLAFALIGSHSLPFAGPGFFAKAQGAQVAWGERVTFSSPVTGFRVFSPDNDDEPVLERQLDEPSRVVELPYPTVLPTLDGVASELVTEEAFFTPLTAAERETYMNRGSVVLQLADDGTRVLEPYGTVLSGQIHALAGVQGSCKEPGRFFTFLTNNLPDLFRTLETFELRVTDNASLCQVTFEIGPRGTQNAIESLTAVLGRFPGYTDLLGAAGFVVDKNSLSSLDPPGRGSTSIDPTCDQIATWLDPIGDNDYGLIFRDGLRTDLGVPASGVTGAGVNVAIIGGGVGPNDNVRCTDALGTVFFRGHDTHLRNIIRAVAPDVDVQAFKVCNAEGTCSAAEIVRALLQTITLARSGPNPHTLVNLSLGGPLPDRPTFEVLRLLGERFGVAVVASGGNGPFAPAHFPASYSSGVADPAAPSLPNVISFAATGLRLSAAGTDKPGYVIAGFNTRANADFFAPGVNVCLNAAQTFRCDTAATFPDTLGATGSSFAAPVGTGLAALFLEDADLSPADLRSCLADNRKQDPVTDLRYAAYGSNLCW